jgi:hypothetical protein
MLPDMVMMKSVWLLWLLLSFDALNLLRISLVEGFVERFQILAICRSINLLGDETAAARASFMGLLGRSGIRNLA